MHDLERSRRREALAATLLTVGLVTGGVAAQAAPDPTGSCFLLCEPVEVTLTAPSTPVSLPISVPPVEVTIPLLPPVEAGPTTRLGDADRMLQLVNGERASAGLAPLSMRADVVGIATDHTRAMLGQRRLFHNPDYLTAPTRQRLGAGALGENVAMNATLDDAHRRLMNSPGHRANILDARFNTVGIAVVTDAAQVLYITQNFAQVRSVATPARPPDTPPPTAPRKQAIVRTVATAPATTTVPAPIESAAPPIAPTSALAAAPPSPRAGVANTAPRPEADHPRIAPAWAAGLVVLVALGGLASWQVRRRLSDTNGA